MAFLWSRFVTRRNLSEVSPVHGPAGSGWWPESSGVTIHFPIPAAASLAVSAQSPSFTRITVYQIPSASCSATVLAPTLRVRYSVPLATSVLTTATPILRWRIAYQVPTGAVSLTATAPAYRSIKRFVVPTVALTTSGYTPALKTRLVIPPRALALATVAPTFKSVLRFAVPLRTLGLTGAAPSLRMLITTRYAIPAGSVVLTTNAGTFRLRYSAPTKQAALGGQVPAFRQVQKWALPMAAAILLTALTPSFRQVYRPTAGPLQAIPHAPTWYTVRRMEVPPQSLTLAARAPTLRTAFRVPTGTIILAPNTLAWRSLVRYPVPLTTATLISTQAHFSVFDLNLPESRKISCVLSARSTTIELDASRNILRHDLPERSLVIEDNRNPLLWEISERTLQGDITMALVKFAKDPGERLTLELNFSKRLLNRTVASASASISQLSGPAQQAGDISAMLDGAASSSGASSCVTQKIKGGALGCSYLVKLKATLSDGDILVGSTQIDVQLGA